MKKIVLSEVARKMRRSASMGLGAMVVASMVLVSCDSPSTKAKLAETQTLNDSLMFVTLQQQNEIADLVGTLGEISTQLDKVNNAINVPDGDEKTDLISQRERLMKKLEAVQQRIEEKQQALDDLQKKYSSALGQNKELKKTIDRMQGEINGYIARIAQYESDIQTKDRQIAQLNNDLSSTQDSLSQVSQENASQKNVMAAQDKMLNSGFYIVGSKKELKNIGVLGKDGLFSATKISSTSFDTSVFHQIDIREVTEIPLGSRDAKIMSQMPKDSYKLEKDYDKNLKIVILDPAQFWSITRYLVVVI
jgi:myosin heavy subunit